MINRILIRIKVAQILYSFLLVESKFNLPDAPSAPTKEKRFAYALYLDMLFLMVKISRSIRQRSGVSPLEQTRFIKMLESDDKVKSLMARYRSDSDFPLAAPAEELIKKVKESALYKNWLKEDRHTDQGDTRLWQSIFDIIIAPDALLNNYFTRRENHTLRGVERMKEMMKETFTNYMGSQDNIADAVTALGKSLDKAHELYFRLLWLPVELTHLHEQALDEKRHKYLVGHEDLNPNMRLAENQLVASLAANEQISSYVDSRHIEWLPDDRGMLQRLLKAILASDLYKEYESSASDDYHTDAEFWRDAFKQIIFKSPDFLEALEDKSVFWNDDLEIIGTFLLKTLRRFDENDGKGEVFDQFKDDEDARFGKELITYVWKNHDDYRDLINEALTHGNWEQDRLAFMDVVILMTALAEILNFPKIPLTASLNEYIELAKSYSTAKSGAFVNGILGYIVRKLREEGKLRK